MILLLISTYLVVTAIVMIFQRRLLYHPPVFGSQQMDEAAQAVRLERWKNSAGQSIGFKRLSPRQPATGLVLITYGNGSYTVACAHYADAIQSVDAFDVYILEYPGYGDRPGKPTQTSLFRAADEAIQVLGTNAPIYLVGESLGSGVSAYLAGTYPDKIAGAILISPFDRLATVAQYQQPIFPVRLLLFDRFPSEDYLRNYCGPIGVTVDGLDYVVPERFGLRLYDGYNGPKRLWKFPDGGHTEIKEEPGKFWKEALEFLKANRLAK